MQTVDVTLLGRTYQVACAPGQEPRLRQLTGMLEDKMRLAAKTGQGAVGEIRLLLLAGLMLADDVLETRLQAADAIAEKDRTVALEEDLMVSAVEHLGERVRSLAGRIDG